MLLGFVFQVSALHFGPLALVQPILALELLFVFGYMKGRFTGIHPLKGATQTMLIGGLAAATAFGLARLFR